MTHNHNNALGRHILVEFFGCSSEILNDVPSIEGSMVDAAKEALSTVINSTFHHFSPYGVSGVVVIQESHLAIHTWPEFQYAAVDIFTCGDTINPWIAYDFLKKAFEAKHGSAMEISRGQIDLLERVDFDINADRDMKEKELRPEYKRDVWFTDKDENIALSLRYTGEILYREKSPYQVVQVIDTFAYGKTLTIDNMVMCSEKDEHAYHEMISHIAMLSHPSPKDILVIGGGDGGTVRELVRHEKLEKVTMVEIDEKVVEASRKYLPQLSKAFEHPKLQLLIYDGIQFVKDAVSESYDIVIVDGSDPEGPATGLFSESFYRDTYLCMKNNGVLVLQSEGPHFNKETMVETFQCLRKIFGADRVHLYLAYIPTYPTGMWSFIYASKGDVHPYNQLDPAKAGAFARKNNLQYYNPEIHRSAFALPTFVKNMLDDSVTNA